MVGEEETIRHMSTEYFSNYEYRATYSCFCGKGVIIKDADRTPGFKDSYWKPCPECGRTVNAAGNVVRAEVD